jgi:hypothetical protein
VNTQCTDEAVAGITIYVFDQTTGDPICDATVTITDGAYTETPTAITSSTCYFAGAYERAGTYDVTVSAPGKTTNTQSGITVTSNSNGCHVLGRTLTFEM